MSRTEKQKERILIVSKTGLISQDVQSILKKKGVYFIALSARNFETKSNFEGYLLDKCKTHRISSLINCAAIINSKECQNNPNLAYTVNAELPRLLSNVCAHIDIKFFQLSTEAVFGSGQFGQIRSESDTPEPKNIYGKSKRDGELNIHPSCRHLILRLPRIISSKTQLFSLLINKIIQGEKIRVANDIYSTPIASFCAAERITNIILEQATLFRQKIIHITGSERLSLHETFIKLLDYKFHSNIIPELSNFFEPNPMEELFKNGGLASNYIEPITFYETKQSFNIGEKNEPYFRK